MSRIFRRAFLPLMVVGAVHLALPAHAAGVPVRLGPGSTLQLTGTSNVHDYESATTATTVSITLRPGSAASSGPKGFAGLVRGSAIRTVDVKVPVRSLHSPRKGLDANLYKALKADANPTIDVHLDRYTPAGGKATGDTIHVSASGTITISGVKKPLTLDARLAHGDGGTWVIGTHTLRMSEFGVKPPRMMMGTLRVRDPVTIRYRLLLLP